MLDKTLTHEHMLQDGTIVKHAHVQESNHNDECYHGHTYSDSHHSHTHTHTHQHTKAVLNRLSKLIGHLESVKHMVEDNRDCSEVLIQLAAVKSAINSTGKVILKEHIEHCIVDAIQEEDMKALEELNRAIDIFMK